MGLDKTFTEAMVVVMAIMSIVIFFINGGCIYIIYTSKVLREKTASIFVYSILMLHLLQGCFVIPFYTAKKADIDSVTSRKIICDGFRFTYMITFYGACVNVLLIGGDRLLAVRLMTSYKTIVTRRRAIIATVSCWTYIFVLCLIPFAPTPKAKFCRYNQQNEWTIFMLFSNTLLPYVFVTISYLYVTIKLDKMAQKTRSYTGTREEEEDTKPVKKKSRAISTFSMFQFNKKDAARENDQKREQDKNIRKVTKLTFIIILAYGLTWAPSIIYYILLKVAPSVFSEEYLVSPAESYVTFFIKFITFFDAIFTPIIYCYFHNDFRKEFTKFWQGLRPKGDVIEIRDETSRSHSYSSR